MKNTPPEIEERMREMMTARSGTERVIMGCEIFDTFRAMIIASLPKDLPEEEFKKQLFERIYGAPMEAFLSGVIDDSKVRR